MGRILVNLGFEILIKPNACKNEKNKPQVIDISPDNILEKFPCNIR